MSFGAIGGGGGGSGGGGGGLVADAINDGTTTVAPSQNAVFDALALKVANPGGSNDDFLQRKAGVYTNRTIAQVKSDLGVVAPIWSVISEGTLGAQAASISWSPSGYSEFRLVLEGASSTAATNADVRLIVNSDTGSNYIWSAGQWWSSSGSAYGGASVAFAVIGRIAGATNSSTLARGLVETSIGVRSGGWLVGRSASASLNSTDQVGPFIGGFWWKNNAAITALSISLSAGNFIAGTYYRLEGR